MPLTYIALIITASPLLIYTGLAFPQAYPRWVLIALLTSAALLYTVVTKKLRVMSEDFTSIDGALVVFAAIITTATLINSSTGATLWGSLERSTGAAFWVLMVCVHFIYKACWKTERGALWLWRGFAITLGLMSIVGIFQKIIPGFIITFSGDRVGGTLGNAIFYGMYLTLSLFLLALGYVKNKNFLGKKTKLWVYLIATIAGISLILTRSRGPLIACVVGILAVGIGNLFVADNLKQTAKRLLILFVGVSVLASGILYFGKISFSSTTIETRVLNWHMAWQGFTARPILGWGWENYRTVVDNFYEPHLTRLSFGETYPDKPHNAQLELLVSGGIAGFTLYLFLIGALVWCVMRLYNKKDFAYADMVIALAFLIVHEVQNLSAFETHGTLIVFIFFTSLLSARVGTLAPTRPSRATNLVILILAAASAAIAAQTISHVKEARILAQLWNISPSDPVAQRPLISKLSNTQSTPYAYEEWQAVSNSVLEPFSQQPENLAALTPEQQIAWDANYQTIISYTERISAAHHDNAWWQLAIGKTWMELFYLTKLPTHADHAIAALRYVHTLNPLRSEPLILIAQIELKKNAPQAALDDITAAVMIDEQLPLARWYRGLILLILKRPQESWNDINFALSNGYAINNSGITAALIKEFTLSNMPEAAAKINALQR